MTSPQAGYSSHFGVDNIPFGVASSQQHPNRQCVTRFEDHVIFLGELDDALADVSGLTLDVLRQETLNPFAALPYEVHQAVRTRIKNTIRSNTSPEQPNGSLPGFPVCAVEHISAVNMHLPVTVSDFTDFSCSLDHVQNASEAMTGTPSTPPAFFHMPIGYAGRCSSLDVSGTTVERPFGQRWEGNPMQSEVIFGRCERMDYELELGCIIGKPLPRKQRVMAANAEDHIFGYVLVNDWSGEYLEIGLQRFYWSAALDLGLTRCSTRHTSFGDDTSGTPKRQESGHYHLAVGHNRRRVASLQDHLSTSCEGPDHLSCRFR